MPRKGPTASAILALFDQGLGGLVAPASIVGEILRQRGFVVSKSNLLHTLNRLALKGDLAKVERKNGGAIYTRPRNLRETSPYHRVVERVPALNIRKKSSTTPRRFDLRIKRAVSRWQDEEVRNGAHDHRPGRACPRCGEGAPKGAGS
jgi:hypothetical protein